MSNKVIDARIKQKRDTNSNWQSKNPTLLNGEIILVDMSDGELRAKIGDGTSKYSLLPFTDEPLRNLIDTVDDKVTEVRELVGDTSVSDQVTSAIEHINTALDGKSDVGHTHTVDSALSSTSTNPVQNKVLFNSIQLLIDGIGSEPVADQIASAVATKAEASDLSNHLADKNNPHDTSLAQLGVTATASELNKLDGATVTTTELNYIKGATSSIQTQLDSLNGRVGETSVSDQIDEAISDLEQKVGDTSVSEQISDAIDKTITELSSDGNVITYTKGDGSTGTIITQDTNAVCSNAELGQGYGVCNTVSTTVDKVVTLNGYTLATGGIVAVKFTNAVPANATMNINSSGAKAIYYKGLAIIDGIINADEIATFMYDGTKYNLLTVDRHRFFSSLVPYGTRITASENSTVDLNSVEFMKVGNYYCSSNSEAKYVSNIPDAGIAFVMAVSSPLSQMVDDESGTWKYRIRKLTHYQGSEYVQYCHSRETAGVWTYGSWKKIITATDNTPIGSDVKPIYVDSSGNLVACTYTIESAVPANAIFTDTVTTAKTTGSGNAVTNITANNGVLTVTKGSNFATKTELDGVCDLVGDVSVATQITNAISTKADAAHNHNIDDVSGLQSALDGKAAQSHGNHVVFSSTAPVMDGTASVGAAGYVARSDHRHPTDTSRAAQADLEALQEVVESKADVEHTHNYDDDYAAINHTHNISDLNGGITLEDIVNLHLWGKFPSTYQEPYFGASQETTLNPSNIDLKSIWFSDKIDYSRGAGKVKLIESQKADLTNTIGRGWIVGKYIYTGVQYFYIPDDATVSRSPSTGIVTISSAEMLYADHMISYVASKTKDTYPENGVKDGYLYKYYGQLGD